VAEGRDLMAIVFRELQEIPLCAKKTAPYEDIEEEERKRNGVVAFANIEESSVAGDADDSVSYSGMKPEKEILFPMRRTFRRRVDPEDAVHDGEMGVCWFSASTSRPRSRGIPESSEKKLENRSSIDIRRCQCSNRRSSEKTGRANLAG